MATQAFPYTRGQMVGGVEKRELENVAGKKELSVEKRELENAEKRELEKKEARKKEGNLEGKDNLYI
tara:strand:- start:43 stop:243 length:201 start_codon:yes stop_codon:yes gene_type:complete